MDYVVRFVGVVCLMAILALGIVMLAVETEAQEGEDE